MSARGRPRSADRVIDIQTHYVAPAAARIVQRNRDRLGTSVDGLDLSGGILGPMFGVDARLRAMDAAGIDVSVLSFAPIGIVEDVEFCVELCQAANDGLLALCATHAGRFVAAAMLPLPDGKAAIAELARIRDEPDLRAIQIVAQTTRYRPDAISLEPLFQAAGDAGLPIIIHPAAGVADLAPQFADYGLASGMHAMVSSALVAARMIQSGMMDRHPGLELILTHLGGILPFLVDRLDSRNSGPCDFPPSHYLRSRLWFDACGYPAGPALRCALATVGADRLLVGSDWPSRAIEPALEAVRDLELSREATRAFLGGNAARWFNPAQPRSVPGLNNPRSDSHRR